MYAYCLKVIKRTYKIIHIFFQLFYGVIQISRAPLPMITIFGGAKILKNDIYFTQASLLASMLVTENISVLTGGGTGIMEAANCGAQKKSNICSKSIGIGITTLDEKKNHCVDQYFKLDYFFVRKWLLINYSCGFIFFPGGFGTLDEFFELLTLLSTKQIQKVPIVLIGSEYWKPFISWLRNEAIDHQLISNSDLSLFVITDDIHEAFSVMKNSCRSQQKKCVD